MKKVHLTKGNKAACKTATRNVLASHIPQDKFLLVPQKYQCQKCLQSIK